ncbi:MAG TPA: alkaline phosphatase family protein, partial [Tepidisphaeraceae bacterium]|nr:alkaline phosphatase family protein [Tepidisphaeraceae bacterium]
MPRLEPGLRRALTAGNATALAVLLLLLAGLGVPRGGASAPAAALPAGDGGPTRRVLLIVVDGLRVDTAADPALMRQTAALAAARGLGTARVENLIPSTIAGITTLATGRPSPPLDFLSDFSAGPSADGGIFAAVARAGGRSFVAGPALWPQRYGRWIAASHAQAAVFGAPDGPLVDAALAALRTAGPDAYRLVVVHLSETDEAAHAHGIDSPGYRAAAGRADDAVGRLARAAGPETAVLITSDHGTTRAGGHAGPEPEVLATPLIALGPGLPSARGLTVRQRDVPALIAAAIGLPPFALVDDARAATRPPSIARYAGPAAVAAAVLAGLWFLTALAGDATGRPQGTALNVALWLA